MSKVRLKIFIAGPYTKPDPERNTHAAIVMGDILLRLGFTPFVPHLTHFWDKECPNEYATWCAYDMEWLVVCQAVLRLPGESPGADREVERARELGIPVCYNLEELLAWRER